MKGSVLSSFCGLRSVWLAFSKASSSGPCGTMQLCRLAPPGLKPPGLASYSPYTRPMNSLIRLRWYQGGRKVSSITSQRGGKITKSQLAVPGVSEGEVSTVQSDGSGCCELTATQAMKS